LLSEFLVDYKIFPNSIYILLLFLILLSLILVTSFIFFGYIFFLYLGNLCENQGKRILNMLYKKNKRTSLQIVKKYKDQNVIFKSFKDLVEKLKKL